jgi:hypothetical protein
MGGDDSQKLLPWRGMSLLSGAQTSGFLRNQTLTQGNLLRSALRRYRG